MALDSRAASLTQRLQGLVGLLDDPEPIWDAIGSAMTENTRLRFTDQKDVDGNTFQPSYRATAQGGQTLRDRGLLQNSVTYIANQMGVEWGVPASFPYARILNEGGTIRPKTKAYLRFKVAGRWAMKTSVTIPARCYLGISQADQQEILGIISDFLSGNVGVGGQLGGLIHG